MGIIEEFVYISHEIPYFRYVNHLLDLILTVEIFCMINQIMRMFET